MSNARPQIRPKLRTQGMLEELVRTVIFVIAVTVLFDMAIPRSLVDGRSMQPTFEDSERLIVSRLHYLAVEPDRGDVIVFNSLALDEPNTMLIKRVIGLPGDQIELLDNQLYINGALVQEDYIREVGQACRCADRTWTLDSDEYFVMGDNRNASHDSRSFGPVPLGNVVGRVVFRYWPLQRIGLIEHRDYPELQE